MVATPDVLIVYQTEWSLDTVESLHIPRHMVKLLLNRAERRGGVLGQDLKPALRCEVIGAVPSDGRTAGNSVNRGVPFVMESPRAKISEAVKKLAEDLIAREDIYITKGCRYVGKAIQETDVSRKYKLLVVGVQKPESDTFVYSPPADFVFEEGMVLIVLGDLDNIRSVKESL